MVCATTAQLVSFFILEVMAFLFWEVTDQNAEDMVSYEDLIAVHGPLSYIHIFLLLENSVRIMCFDQIYSHSLLSKFNVLPIPLPLFLPNFKWSFLFNPTEPAKWCLYVHACRTTYWSHSGALCLRDTGSTPLNSHQLPGTSPLAVQLHEPLFHPRQNSPSLSPCRSYAYSHSCHELSYAVVLVFLADTLAALQNQPLLLALTILRLPFPEDTWALRGGERHSVQHRVPCCLLLSARSSLG